ncbi:MAG: hypothetical protein K1060chlam2_00987 [Chlamydiae bacterium]|nr:hypothetical protein [Chlamydiota bacterium]
MSVLLALILASLPISPNLSSDSASYDGEILYLEGNVSLEHELGRMEAGSAKLHKNEESDELPFSEIHLQSGVSLSFQNHAELFCHAAHLDFQNLRGTFTSERNPVVYRDSLEKKFELRGREIDLTLIREGGTCAIDSLLARDDVHIVFGGEYHLDSDRALFQSGGLLKAFSHQEKKWCHLTHEEDIFDAATITIDLNKNLLLMEESIGVISSFFPSRPERRCHVFSKLLIVDRADETLTLQGDVVIEDPFLGKLVGEESVRLKQKSRFGKKSIETIEAVGKTVLISRKGLKLTSFGTLELNRDRLELRCVSPTVDGSTPLDKQLIYVRGDLTLYADSASLECSFKGLSLEPHLINLDGNVRIFSSNPSRPFHCGTADHIRYNPTTSEIHLYADRGEHVLFWHKEKKLKLSAPEILITTDPESNEETIKGIGVVQFSVNHDDDAQLERLFPLFGKERL